MVGNTLLGKKGTTASTSGHAVYMKDHLEHLKIKESSDLKVQ